MVSPCNTSPGLTFWTFWSHIGCMSVGRPLQFDPRASLEGAMEAFWSRGYEATSLQDLLAATGLSKSSLYREFGDKQQLFAHCLDHYCRQQAEAMHQRLEHSDSALGFIEQLFYNIADTPRNEAQRRGCLLMNTASEFGLSEPEITDRVASGKAAFARVFRAAVERAQGEGDIPAERNSKALADYLVSNMSGLRNLLKTGMERRDARAVVATMLAALR